MPKYYEEKETDGRACAGVREDLRDCLLESSCIQERKCVKECLREGYCRGLWVSFFECKRSMITEQDLEEERDTEVTHEETASMSNLGCTDISTIKD